MSWMWVLAAVAWAEEPVASVGAIELPITPHDDRFDGYVGLLEVKGAGESTWESQSEGFTCAAAGDWLEVRVERETWPSEVPKKVVCASASGKKKKVRTVIDDDRYEPMLVSDGTLVMPRGVKEASIYEGPTPDADLVVQQGVTGDLNIHCDIVTGPRLKVVVDVEARDGVGYCTLRTKYGESMRVPIKILTIK